MALSDLNLALTLPYGEQAYMYVRDGRIVRTQHRRLKVKGRHYTDVVSCVLSWDDVNNEWVWEPQVLQ